MKKLYNFFAIILVIIFIIILTGCNKEKQFIQAEVMTEEEIIEAESEKLKELRKEFFEKSQNLNAERDICLSEFYNNPVITEEFLNTLKANEAEYAELEDWAENLSEDDYAEISKMFENGEIHDGIEVIDYTEKYTNSYSSYDWGTYHFDTCDGIKILWFQNVKIISETDTEKVFEIINFEEDAYLLHNGPTGFWMVQIVSIYKEGTYTKDMYDGWYNNLEAEKEKVLCDFLKNPVITEEFLEKLYANEKGYRNLMDSAKKLPEEDYARVMLSIELGMIKDGIHTVAYDKKYYQKYYRYVDGEFIIDPDIEMEVEWSQNFEDEEISDSYCRVYKIKNAKEDAYLLIDSGIGHQLIRITAIKKK